MIDRATGEIVELRTPYNYDVDAVSEETGTDCGPETKTQQQFKDEVDINTIVDRFMAAGELPPQLQFPTEQDFTETFDFQTSMNVIVKARESFMELPAKARARFDNDPQKFMEFIHDPENKHEAVKLGLASWRPEPEKKPDEVKPIVQEDKKQQEKKD